MSHLRAAMQTGLVASVLMISACSEKSMTPASYAMAAHLSGESEVPRVAGNGIGTLEASLNGQSNQLSWTITYSELSGPPTAGHFHGPAIGGQNAGVTVPLSGALTSPIKGVATLTAAQATELMAGKWYINLHTAAYPDGEIRGQIARQR
jgi:CHRD domain